MSTDRLFRNSVFGGFNKDDVIDYIENMKNEFFEYRSQVEQTVRDLNGKVSSLEEELKGAKLKLAEADREVQEASKRAAEAIENSEAATAAAAERAAKAAQEKFEKEKAALEAEKSESSPLGEINLATDRLRRVADEICNNLSSFIEKISESSFAVTIAQPEPAPAPTFETKKEPKVEEKKEEIPSGTDAASILSFIDGLLGSEEKPAKEEKKDEKSCLDGLLPSGLFN